MTVIKYIQLSVKNFLKVKREEVRPPLTSLDRTGAGRDEKLGHKEAARLCRGNGECRGAVRVEGVANR